MSLVQNIIFSAVLGCCFLNGANAGSLDEEQQISTLEPKYSYQCGEILSGSRYGVIEYKYGTIYDQNERCVWTIRIPEASQIRFDLYPTSIDYNRYDGVVISSFARTAGVASAMIGQRVLQLTGLQTLTLSGNVAIVTFFSQSSTTYKGFHLEYFGIGESGGQNVSSASTDFISNLTSTAVSVVINHPKDGMYADQELSTFVISYPHFLRPPRSPGYNFEAQLSVDLDRSCFCCDAVLSYWFQPNVGWTHSEYMCGALHKMELTDILLVILKSDEQRVSTGLRLEASFHS